MEKGRRGLIGLFREASWLTADRAQAYARVLAAVTVVGGVVWIGLSHGGLDVTGKPLGTDFLSFWAASKLALAGTPEAVYDVTRHAAAERAAFAGIDPGYFAFFYPPIFLLFCWPLALLPYGAALAAWLGLTVVAYVRVIAALGGRGWSLTLPILAFPAVLVTLGHGQNAFLTTALFGGAILALARGRPILAGMLFGALVCKPHLGLLIPAFLIASGAWTTILAAGCTVLALAAGATWAFGPSIWPAFRAATPLARQALEGDLVGAAKMQSAFAAVQLWHGPLWLAYGVQLLVAIAVAAVLVLALHRGLTGVAAGAALVTASLLASPFLLDYDLTLLAVPLIWVVTQAARTGFLPWEKVVVLAGFTLPLVSRLVATDLAIPLAPLVVGALLLVVVRRGRVAHVSCAQSVRPGGLRLVAAA